MRACRRHHRLTSRHISATNHDRFRNKYKTNIEERRFGETTIAGSKELALRHDIGRPVRSGAERPQQPTEFLQFKSREGVTRWIGGRRFRTSDRCNNEPSVAA